MPLNPKQRAFVREYLKDHNATQAAIRAGYSERTARQQASDLLAKPDISEAVRVGDERLNEKAGLTAELVRRTIFEALTFDPGSTVNTDGDTIGLEEMPAEVRKALAGFCRRPIFHEGVKCGEVVEAKWPDKLAAAMAAARLLGIDKPPPSDEIERPINIRIVLGPKDG